MGSISRPLQPGADLLAEIEAINRRAGLDYPQLAFAFNKAMDPRKREATVRYLVAFLSRCVAGSAPDYRHWEPPDE